MISLAALEDKLSPLEKPKEFDLTESIPQSEDTHAKQFIPNPSSVSRKRKLAERNNSRKSNFERDESEEAGEAVEPVEPVESPQADDDELSKFD